MKIRVPSPATLPRFVVAALLFTLGAIACRRADLEGPARLAGSRSGVPGIVLLCMDTLRADSLATGPVTQGAQEWMPELDAFAKGATAFCDATSSSSWTAPSAATLLTGLLPANTGVHGATVAGALPGSVTTLAEALHERGFSTAACTSGGWIVPERGYGQGFDSFSASYDVNSPEAEIAAWQARRAKDAPFFLFLHSCTAHDPYGPKDARWESDPDPAVAVEARAIVREASASGWRLPAGAAPWFLELSLFDCRGRVTLGQAIPAEPLSRLWDLSMDWLDGEGRGTPELASLVQRAPRAYREGLATADETVARTLAALDALHLPEATVIAVVGDHGEALGEHGTLSHGRFLYDEVTRVPLVIRAPGRLPAGRVVAGSCGLVDVAPTLLALAGVAPKSSSERPSSEKRTLQMLSGVPCGATEMTRPVEASRSCTEPETALASQRPSGE